eukprot:gene161-214_t
MNSGKDPIEKNNLREGTSSDSSEIKIAAGVLSLHNKSFRSCDKMTKTDINSLLEYSNFNTLEHLNFHGAQIGSFEIINLLFSLERLPNLQTLNLSSKQKIGSNPVQFFPFFEESVLRTHTFYYWSEDIIKTTFVAPPPQSRSHLEGGGQIDDLSMYILANALEKNIHLTTLDLSNNAITYLSIPALSKALKGLYNLEILKLDNNCYLFINGSMPTEIVQLLQSKNQHAKKLILSPINQERANNIIDEWPFMLADALSYLTKLKEVYLGNTGLDWRGILHFSDAFKYCPELEAIALNDSQVLNLGIMGLADALLHLPKLKTIMLNGAHVPDAGGLMIFKRTLAKLAQEKHIVEVTY